MREVAAISGVARMPANGDAGSRESRQGKMPKAFADVAFVWLCPERFDHVFVLVFAFIGWKLPGDCRQSMIVADHPCLGTEAYRERRAPDEKRSCRRPTS